MSGHAGVCGQAVSEMRLVYVRCVPDADMENISIYQNRIESAELHVFPFRLSVSLYNVSGLGQAVEQHI